MLKITVCVGSSCHIKGSQQIIDKLQNLIAENNIGDKVEILGTFCLGKCQEGVSVAIGEEIFSVSPETVADFFKDNVLKVINK